MAIVIMAIIKDEIFFIRTIFCKVNAFTAMPKRLGTEAAVDIGTIAETCINEKRVGRTPTHFSNLKFNL